MDWATHEIPNDGFVLPPLMDDRDEKDDSSLFVVLVFLLFLFVTSV